jgi:threonine synthase
LPVARFAIATNANDEVPKFLATGRYDKIEPSRVCISNAMNVGHPSNLARLVALYGGQMDETGRLGRAPDMGALRRDFYAISIDDAETRETIRCAHADHGVLLEPHGAVGWAGLTHLCAEDPAAAALTAVSLETAHPAKFPEEVQAITGVEPVVPPSLKGLDALAERFGEMKVEYGAFKAHLEKEYRG